MASLSSRIVMQEIQIGTPLGFRMTIPHHEQKSMGILFFDGRRFRFLVCDMMQCRKGDITPKKRNAKGAWAVPSSSGNRNDVPLRFACGEQSFYSFVEETSHPNGLSLINSLLV